MMKSLWLIITVTLAFCSQASATVSYLGKQPQSLNKQIETGEIRGKVTDSNLGEPLPFVQVKVFSEDIMVTGALTDIDGEFRIANLEPGVYDLLIEHIGYPSKRLKDIKVKQGSITKIDSELLEIEDNIRELKPMIYLYPEEDTQVSVQLSYDGNLTHTYPKSNGNWEVLASSDGKLTEKDGRNYYGLFWEGIPNDPIQPKCGTIVSRDSLIPFLESSLDQLGLNYKESNEFIVFWLPILEQNPYNLIYFAGSDYTDHAELNIDPQPNNIIRVMMGYVPLNVPIKIAPQILPEKPSREGFTVVEWGGTKCTLPDS
jgi:hypothetical protein